MKINILYNFKDGPFGGGNQFLKALSKEWIQSNKYEKDPEKADIILFNSYPFHEEYLFNKVLKLKKKGKIIIHRLDGPISLIRNKDFEIDQIIKKFNDLCVDGTIYQTEWCKSRNSELFNMKSPYEIVIINAPDNKIFNRTNKTKFDKNTKIKIIATSWSNNLKKGFKVYKYLDENLDFSKYEMTFVGNSPFKFKNIKHIPPVTSKKLAVILKDHDIYITASEKDPCSNSLIEALSCGLPSIGLADGGHPELIRNGGELFNKKEEIIKKIEKIENNYFKYQKMIPNFSINNTAEKYYNFCSGIYDSSENKTSHKFGLKENLYYLLIIGKIITFKIKSVFSNFINKI